jgi:hypothetical protein
MKLTEQELEILQRTAELWNLFCALPDRHPSDAEEMARDIHSIQHRIMSRLAVRAHPDFFTR